MALWCVLTHQAPSVYRELTLLEREAFLTAVKRTTPKAK